MISNVAALYIFCDFEGHHGMPYFDVINMQILPLIMQLRMLLMRVLKLRTILLLMMFPMMMMLWMSRNKIWVYVPFYFVCYNYYPE